MPPKTTFRKFSRKFLKKIRNNLAYFFVVSALFIFRKIPRSIALSTVSFLGIVANFFFRKEYKLAREQLSMALGREKTPGEIEKIARPIFGNIGMNFVDAVRIPLMTPESIKDICVPHNFEVFEELRKTGRGAVLITSHSGCWELLGVYLATLGMPLYAVSKKLYDERLEKVIVEIREKGGMRNITRGKETREIVRALNSGGLVGVLPDQDYAKLKGIFVDFFGRPAYTTISTATLSLKFKVPVIPVFVCRERDNRHHMYAFEKIDIKPSGDEDTDIFRITDACSKVMENFIREHPSEWVWFHKRWKTQKTDK